MRIEEMIELGISFGDALNYRVNAGNPVCFGYPVFLQGILYIIQLCRKESTIFLSTGINNR